MTSCGHVFCWHCILMHFYKCIFLHTKHSKLASAPSVTSHTNFKTWSPVNLSTLAPFETISQTKSLSCSKPADKTITEFMILTLWLKISNLLELQGQCLKKYWKFFKKNVRKLKTILSNATTSK